MGATEIGGEHEIVEVTVLAALCSVGWLVEMVAVELLLPLDTATFGSVRRMDKSSGCEEAFVIARGETSDAILSFEGFRSRTRARAVLIGASLAKRQVFARINR